LRIAAFTFNDVCHEVEARGNGVHYLFTADIDRNGKPLVTGRKYGQLLGPVTIDTVIDAVRSAINSVTDLPRPIK
jgi:hypothetical protein